MEYLVVVDCEATGPCPGFGELTEFGAVAVASGRSFHGVLAEARPNPAKPVYSEIVGARFDPAPVFQAFAMWLEREANESPVFVSDNPAYDFPWISHGFLTTLGCNPFGHSARRIGDFYAGLMGDFDAPQTWKRLRQTPHDHNPVHDAQGNAEALLRLLRGEY
jgi:hypothetical protein